MELLELLVTLVCAVLAMLLVATALWIDRKDITRAWQELRPRARVALPFLGFLGIVLLFNAHYRITVHHISYVVGFNITPYIVAFEGEAILLVQALFGDRFDLFFSFMYIYGYVFLLVFPLLAYFVLARLDMFKSLTLAYAANYGIGLFCYMIFIAYGPRNYLVIEPIVEPLPAQFQLLTTEFNQNTNVFPSLHTSLSATVMLFAWRTKETYRHWMYMAMFIGGSVIVATMYLGIHWAIDVVAGILLAGFSYWLGIKAIDDEWFAAIDIRSRLTSIRTGFR